MDKVREKLQLWAAENYSQKSAILLIGTTVLMSLNFLITLMLGLNLLIVDLVLTAVALMGYLLFKDYEFQVKNRSQKLLKADMIFLCGTAVAFPLVRMAKWSVRTGGSGTGLLTVALMMALLCMVLLMFFFHSDNGKKLFQKIDSSFSGGKISTESQNSGDVVLCKDKELVQELFKGKSEEELNQICEHHDFIEREAKAKRFNVYEVLPFKDRFLHMLILGATGTGKTSQILLPMVNQDIQNMNCGVTVLEPKGDFAQKAAMMAKHYGRPFMYFDPSMKNCPHFNPMAGKEADVVENMATTFRMLNPDSPTFFLDLSEQLMRNAVKVLKRLDKDCGIEGEYANLIMLSRLLQNSGGAGRTIVSKLIQVSSSTPEEAKENADIIAWFQNDYFAERSKIYENTSGVRSQVAKITSNEYLREVLNPIPSKGEKNDIDFDKHLEEGGVICISTAQGTLRDLSKFLGYFIILQLQSAVFRRKGDEDTRRPHFLYIDEFQTYSNPGFSDMLTQGRSYRVASHLATQARAQMAMGGGRDGKNFVELVSTNARNVILFPGCNKDDADYYSKQFGEYEKIETMVGISRKRFNMLTGGLDRLGHPTESIREQKVMTARFTGSELTYRRFGEVVYCIIKDNSIQYPKVGLTAYIPFELNIKLSKMVTEYIEENRRPDGEEFIDKYPIPEFGAEQSTDAVQLPADSELTFAPQFDHIAHADELDNRQLIEQFEVLADDAKHRDNSFPLERLDDDYGDPFDGIC